MGQFPDFPPFCSSSSGPHRALLPPPAHQQEKPWQICACLKGSSLVKAWLGPRASSGLPRGPQFTQAASCPGGAQQLAMAYFAQLVFHWSPSSAELLRDSLPEVHSRWQRCQKASPMNKNPREGNLKNSGRQSLGKGAQQQQQQLVRRSRNRFAEGGCARNAASSSHKAG